MSASVLYMSMSLDGFIAGPTFEPAGGCGGDHHDGVPIFVLSRRKPGSELELHVIPVLFGQGRRLFDERDPEHIELERTRTLEGEDGVTHMHYRVRR